MERNNLARIRLNDVVELWCCGANVPGAWLESRVKRIRNGRYCVGKVLSTGSLWVERERLRLVKPSGPGNINHNTTPQTHHKHTSQTHHKHTTNILPRHTTSFIAVLKDTSHICLLNTFKSCCCCCCCCCNTFYLVFISYHTLSLDQLKLTHPILSHPITTQYTFQTKQQPTLAQNSSFDNGYKGAVSVVWVTLWNTTKRTQTWTTTTTKTTLLITAMPEPQQQP